MHYNIQGSTVILQYEIHASVVRCMLRSSIWVGISRNTDYFGARLWCILFDTPLHVEVPYPALPTIGIR